MQTSHLWNKLHIHRPQAVVWLLFALLITGLSTSQIQAQVSAKSRTINMPEYDSRWLHYGFQIGIFDYGTKAHYSSGNSNLSVITQRKPSFSLGFITNFRLKDDLWALRVLPNVSFYERAFSAQTATDTTALAYEATVVEIPVLIKYKSRRRKNQRMYALAGLTLGWEVGNKPSEGVGFKKNNLEFTYGGGFDLYWSFFKFSPEIRFSHGLFNLLDINTGPLGTIDRIYTHKVALYLNFE